MGPRSRAVPSAAPVVAALVAIAVVVLVTVPARPGGGSGPVPPAPLPVSLDVGGQSLDRCALALDATGLAARYPARGAWRPVAARFTGDTVVTMLDAEVPFVCATDPRTVQVSDPGAAVPVGAARLLLTSAHGVVAAVAPVDGAVEVTAAGTDPPPGDPARFLLRTTGTPLTSPDQLVVVVTGPAGTGSVARPPDRLAPPALDLTDRPWEPADRPRGTSDLLDLCRSAQLGPEPPRGWQTAHVLAHRRGEATAYLVVAIDTATVGGCAVGPDGATPMRVWRIGLISDGPRPFTWLPRPGEVLPDVGDDIAAGPVQPDVARMEVADGTGRRWDAGVAGGIFATQLPAGVAPDARGLTVRVLDAAHRVMYEGPAAG